MLSAGTSSFKLHIYIYIYVYIHYIEAVKYFEVKVPTFFGFYLLPKIHKPLNNVPGRPAISNCGNFTENISTFLDFYLQPLPQAVKLYIKDTNDCLNRLLSLPKLPGNTILYTVDVVGVFPNIPHEQGPSSIRERLDNRMGKYILSDTM